MNQNGRGPLAPVIKGIAAGVGLVSEYRHYRKEQHAHKEQTIVRETAVSETVDRSLSKTPEPMVIEVSEYETSEERECAEHIISDEKQWHLDEAQDDLAGEAEMPKVKTPHDPAKMIKQFTDAHPLKMGCAGIGIALPVILPQRRPKDRTRGFIRAYAPDLENCDIDEKTFMELIEVFNTATLASPWLDAINLCSLALVTLPTAISQAVSIAIAIAVDITKNMQSRYRHHYVLDQLNDEYFRPRGLYALVLTWNPDSTALKVDVNLNEKIAEDMTKPQGMYNKVKHNFSPSSGNTVGTAFSETAPLVFPILDSFVHSEGPEAKEFKQKVKAAKGLVGEYFDRRAQAQHAGEHPDSQLNVTKPVFTSRYSDPNHPSNNGDLLSLVTGGKLSRPLRGGLISAFAGGPYQGRTGGRGFSRFQRYGSGYNQPYGGAYNNDPYAQNDYYGGQGYQNQLYQSQGMGPGFGLGARNGILAGGIKRVFQHHVLYLSIVNMPSDEELAEAKNYLEHARGSPPAPEEMCDFKHE